MKKIIIVFVVLLAIVAAEEIKSSENHSIALGDDVDVEGRRRHRIHRFLPYFSILGKNYLIKLNKNKKKK